MPNATFFIAFTSVSECATEAEELAAEPTSGPHFPEIKLDGVEIGAKQGVPYSFSSSVLDIFGFSMFTMPPKW
jgi:hypothetical protein